MRPYYSSFIFSGIMFVMLFLSMANTHPVNEVLAILQCACLWVTLGFEEWSHEVTKQRLALRKEDEV